MAGPCGCASCCGKSKISKEENDSQKEKRSAEADKRSSLSDADVEVVEVAEVAEEDME